MAIYIAGVSSWTPVAHADGATALANNSYLDVRTTTASTERIVDIYIAGTATASTVNQMALRRVATTATATPTNQTPAAANTLSIAATTQFHAAATTGPTLASTVHLGNFSLNTFGGVVRWVAAPGEEIWATVGSVPNGEIVLDSISGTGTVSTDIRFEEI